MTKRFKNRVKGFAPTEKQISILNLLSQAPTCTNSPIQYLLSVHTINMTAKMLTGINPAVSMVYMFLLLFKSIEQAPLLKLIQSIITPLNQVEIKFKTIKIHKNKNR